MMYINPEEVPAVNTLQEHFVSFVLFNDAMLAGIH